MISKKFVILLAILFSTVNSELHRFNNQCSLNIICNNTTIKGFYLRITIQKQLYSNKAASYSVNEPLKNYQNVREI